MGWNSLPAVSAVLLTGRPRARPTGVRLSSLMPLTFSRNLSVSFGRFPRSHQCFSRAAARPPIPAASLLYCLFFSGLVLDRSFHFQFPSSPPTCTCTRSQPAGNSPTPSCFLVIVSSCSSNPSPFKLVNTCTPLSSSSSSSLSIPPSFQTTMAEVAFPEGLCSHRHPPACWPAKLGRLLD